MNTERRQAREAVEAAREATDLFGPVHGSQRAGRREYRRLAALLHPDGGGDVEVFERLVALFDEWRSPAGAIVGRRGTYTLGRIVGQGSVSVVYEATSDAGRPVAVKVPRSAASATFVERERAALRRLAQFTDDPANAWLAPYFPRLLDTADVDGGRPVNVVSAHGRAQGFVDAAAVATADGLDGRDWAWIHRRLLRAVAGAHRIGLVHGAVVPENILIHPEGHGVVLAGWSFAAEPGQAPAGRIASRRDLYPPGAEPAGPALDVYMLHATMAQMLASGERRQRMFAAGCMQASPRMRPAAVDLLEEYDDLLEDLYGPRTFRRFPYTVSA
ncbi:hypothetical protein nbrc107696_41860 [Gordonia spumicola]|uniref:non-specific serine/threonine protein kinase n=1 Tax=Gordonia spumicola TaxID=589161 RepID=A0A7I9VFE4_9ACTN|nr:adenylate cyclase [Gordonia spumicola]GEE03740.1 hypothetical protein nbrc107696_41860 [Gordonia spumicola]